VKSGWRTSELVNGAFYGVTIATLARLPIESLGKGVAVGCACLALAWIAGRFNDGRAAEKRAHAETNRRKNALPERT